MDRSYLELLSKRIWEMAPLHWTAVPGILYIETTLLNSGFIIWLTTTINWELTDFWVKSPVNDLGLCTPFKNALYLCHATITMERNFQTLQPTGRSKGSIRNAPPPFSFNCMQFLRKFWANRFVPFLGFASPLSGKYWTRHANRPKYESLLQGWDVIYGRNNCDLVYPPDNFQVT